MGFRGNRSSRVACADLSDVQQPEKLNATTSPPRARKASRARAAAAAGCLKTSYIWLPLLLSCCASTRCRLSLSYSLSPASSSAWCVEPARHCPTTLQPALGFPTAQRTLHCKFTQPSHLSLAHDLWCPSHYLENVCSLGLRNVSRDLERQRCALGLDGGNSPFPWGTGSLLCLWRTQAPRGAPNHE